jgi:hypothetical protein
MRGAINTQLQEEHRVPVGQLWRGVTEGATVELQTNMPISWAATRACAEKFGNTVLTLIAPDSQLFLEVENFCDFPDEKEYLLFPFSTLVQTPGKADEYTVVCGSNFLDGGCHDK